MDRLTHKSDGQKMICRYEDCDTCEGKCPLLNEDNILEENRRMKQEVEDQRDRLCKAQQQERKQKEIALIEADEWKKRVKEKDEEIRKLKKTINEQDGKIEQLEQQQDSLKTEAEMAKAEAEKTRREYAEKRDCAEWLKTSLEKYYGYEWARVTKTQLVDILKKIMNEKEGQQEKENGTDNQCHLL